MNLIICIFIDIASERILVGNVESHIECADELVAAGVEGIWNFSSVNLAVPPGVIVQNVDLAQSLAVLSHAIARR